MLSCEDVRAHLGALETGEPVAGELRDHLASCDACREEAGRIHSDLEVLRSELASLAPSPFLEDAVLQSARDTETGGAAKRAWWLPAGIGIAAAAVLVALIFIAKQPGDERAAGGGDPYGKDPGGPSLVAFPPTTAQAATLRKARLAKTSQEVQAQFYGMLGAPPPGMVIIGRGLLARLAPKPEEGGSEQELDVTLGAPGWRGAACRVRARIVREYSGNLIVPETLGRALGLHEHERPVRITVGGDTSMSGERARAQIRIAGKDLETDVEVLREGVPLPAHPLHAGGLPQTMRIVVHGERPDSGYTGRKITPVHDPVDGFGFNIHDATWSRRETGKGAFELGILKQGPMQSVLSYEAGKLPRCIVFLPPLDIGGGGVLAWAFRMERVQLKQPLEPGAAITIARVWRGRTAIPSRESVAHTWADAQGRVSFVHQRGERGPLRAREVRKDGSVHWHELAQADAPKGKLRPLVLDPDGQVSLLGWQFRLWNRPKGDEAPDATALAALRDKLRVVAEAAGRDERGNSKLTIGIVAYPDAAWKRIETLLQACVQPDVRIIKLQFAFPTDDAGTPYTLPLDTGLNAIKMKVSAFEVRLHWQGPDLHWKTSGGVGAHGGPLDDSAKGLPALEAVIRAARPDPNKLWYQGTIRPLGAARKALPYAALRQLIARMQAAGVDQVLLQSSPPRRKR